MSTLWRPQILSDIATRIRTEENIRFWDEDDNGNPMPLGDEHIIRYLEEFLPTIGIFNLLEDGTKGIPHKTLVFFYENRIDRINAKQFETVVRKVLEEAGYNRINQMMHFLKSDYFGKDVLTSVPCLEGKRLLRDTRTSSFRFFSNGYVEVTRDKVTAAMPYSILPEDIYIWNDLVSPREYRPDAASGGHQHFRDFVANLSRNSFGAHDKQAFERLQIVIGYLCHRFHQESQRKCVVLMDRLDDDSQIGRSNGGTGKSLLIRCLREVLHVISLNGKAFKKSTEDRFALAGVDEAHELVCFDDAAEQFQFESIFPHITGEFFIRRMRANPIAIPGSRAPKIVITTNHPLQGSDMSHRRRQVLVEVSSYYRQILQETGETPADVHGGMDLCSDSWSDHDWNAFYQFIFECIQVYLTNGLPRHSEESEIYRRAQLMRKCGNAELLDLIHEIVDCVATSGDEWFTEQYYAAARSSASNCPHTDAMLLGLLKEVATEHGYLFNPHKNGATDKQRLTDERWNRWVSLGLNEVPKRDGSAYCKDDRVGVFRISKQASSSDRRALEGLLVAN